jgi:hypothetical protein
MYRISYISKRTHLKAPVVQKHPDAAQAQKIPCSAGSQKTTSEYTLTVGMKKKDKKSPKKYLRKKTVGY